MKFLLAVPFIAVCLLIPQSRGAALPSLRVPLEVAVETLDPVEAEDFVTIRILLNLGAGLVTLDKNLNPVPGLAKFWKISDEGKTYVFELGDHQWSNGQKIVAADFIRGFQNVFSPFSSAKIGVPLLDVVAGARDYKNGKLVAFDKVGVRALTENQIEFHLTKPAPYFLSVLALPVFFPHPKEPTPYKITAGVPTSGSYLIHEIKKGHIILDPNPSSAESAKNRLDFTVVTEGSTAMALYEKRKLDMIFKIPSSDYERMKSDPGLVTRPWLSTYYLGFNISHGIFENKNKRQAIIEAVDRRGLEKILRDPQHVSSSWIPTPLSTSDENYGPAFDPASARRHWVVGENAKAAPARAIPLKTGLANDNQVTLYFDAQEKNVLVTSYIQQQIKKNLGVEIRLQSMEWKSYLQFLKTEKPAFFRFGWLAAFPDPLSHLGVFTSDNPNNYTGYSDQGYDRLVNEIAALSAGPVRTQLIRKAQEKLLTEDVVIFPLYHYVQCLLIRPSWRDFEVTPMGLLYFHRIQPQAAPK